jgi:hypothetical protein
MKTNSPYRGSALSHGAVLAGVALSLVSQSLTAEPPQAEISNGQIQARLFLPDARDGYYRGTRFDWSGVVASLRFKGHDYYGPWFDRMDPKVNDFTYEGERVVAGPCSAITGPAEEFQSNGSALGWDEAKPGGTFIKIGVGVLRKDSTNYSFARLYEMVDPGKWTLRTEADSITFTHELSDVASGYAYVYRKSVRVTAGKPELVLDHSLKNTGRHVIQTATYNHNFLVLDRQPPGPDFTITFPFPLRSSRPPIAELAQVRGSELAFARPLRDRDVVYAVLEGFGTSANDHQVRIHNGKTGAGLKITGDRPLSRLAFWAMRNVLSVEPFIAMTIEPGGEFAWRTAIEYDAGR